MKNRLLIALLFSATALLSFETFQVVKDTNGSIIIEQVASDRQTPKIVESPVCNTQDQSVEPLLEGEEELFISVVGQGVAPMNTFSPAQAYALAKRAAVADAYRLIAERVRGVRIEGQDLIKNMMVKRSTIRTSVQAMIRNANIVETTFKEGLCEVEMEITISRADFAQ